MVVGFDGGKDPELEAEPFSMKAPCAMVKVFVWHYCHLDMRTLMRRTRAGEGGGDQHTHKTKSKRGKITRVH